LSWYIIQTLSGQEDKVRSNILKQIDELGLKDKVTRVLLPEEEMVEIKGGKRIVKMRKMYPGYLFVEMVMDQDVWYMIRQTVGVARFIGDKAQPIPVADREMQRVLKQIGIKEEKIEVAFEKGEAIRVISGAFRGYSGTVQDINVARNKLKTLINIFGRDTPVEVDFDQAEKGF
jgi:transcriptional antiterminator NusG